MSKVIIWTLISIASLSLSADNGPPNVGGKTGDDVINADFSAAKCLINKRQGDAIDKNKLLEDEIKKVAIQRQTKKTQYDNSCTQGDRNLFFDFSHCLLKACETMSDGISDQQMSTILNEKCPQGRELATKLTDKCRIDIYNR